MSEFEVGDEVQIGTHEYPPGNDNKPWYGRVICNDAKNIHMMSVIVLVKEYDHQWQETMKQYDSEGRSLNERMSGENGWKYPESRLYHRAE